jgi:radical SAM superfamily enzyme YgiQ (UPF0313 family)
VQLIDENVEPIDFDRCAAADIVGVTGMSVQRTRMREIVRELKARGCFVVIGGPWVTVQEDYFAPDADAIFVGEAETTWPRFLQDFAEGRPERRYEQVERTDMSTVPVPRYDLLKMRRYAFGSIQFSRGCPFTCEFCDIIVTFGRKPRIKTAAQVVAELDSLWRRHGVATVFIVDDNLIGDRKQVRVLLKAVIAWQQANDYPLMFLTEASLDLAEDAEMLDLMSQANIRIVFVGIETPNADALRETRKHQNLRPRGGTLVERVHRIQDAGLEVWSGHIVGFDSDESDIFERQMAFVEDARIVTAMVGMLSAIPKTPLHARLAREGRLDPEDQPESGTNVIPLRMGRSELRDGYVRVMTALYDPASYERRLRSLYLDGPLGSLAHWPRRSRLARWRHDLAMTARCAFIALRLRTRVADAGLRRFYRQLLSEALRRRSPQLFEIVVMKCAMHYHANRLMRDIAASQSPSNTI